MIIVYEYFIIPGRKGKRIRILSVNKSNGKWLMLVVIYISSLNQYLLFYKLLAPFFIKAICRHELYMVCISLPPCVGSTIFYTIQWVCLQKLKVDMYILNTLFSHSKGLITVFNIFRYILFLNETVHRCLN